MLHLPLIMVRNPPATPDGRIGFQRRSWSRRVVLFIAVLVMSYGCRPNADPPPAAASQPPEARKNVRVPSELNLTVVATEESNDTRLAGGRSYISSGKYNPTEILPVEGHYFGLETSKKYSLKLKGQEVALSISITGSDDSFFDTKFYGFIQVRYNSKGEKEYWMDSYFAERAMGWYVTAERVRGITDQKELAKIAVNDATEGCRRAAVEKLDDKVLLSRIAVADKSEFVREAAVRKTSEQALLAKIAIEDMDGNVRSAATEGLNDPVLLQTMGMWISPELTERVSDQGLLAKIATEAKNSNVQRAAVAKLTDQQVLRKIAKDTNNYLLVREAAVAKLTDQELLAKLATEDPDNGVRVVAVSRLTDQGTLGRIATEDKHPNVRWSAVGKLTDDVLLGKIARQDADPSVRTIAVGKLKDEVLLGTIAQQDADPSVRTEAVGRLADNDLVSQISRRDQSTEVRDAAKRRTTELLAAQQRNWVARIRNSVGKPARDLLIDLALLQRDLAASFSDVSVEAVVHDQATDVAEIHLKRPDAMNFPPDVAYLVRVNLQTPGLEIKLDGSRTQKTLTSTFARDHQCQIAFSGESSGSPWRGNFVVDGSVVMTEEAGNERPFLAFDKRNIASFTQTFMTPRSLTPDKFNVINGRHDAIIKGVVQKDFMPRNTGPRTLMGINRDGSTLFLLILQNTKLNFEQAGNLLKIIGAHNAMHCDSEFSCIFFNKLNAVANSPSDQPERPTYTHFGITLK